LARVARSMRRGGCCNPVDFISLHGCLILAHRVISLRLGIWSLSGHSGLCTPSTRQIYRRRGGVRARRLGCSSCSTRTAKRDAGGEAE